ncbi:MAG: hypothetical protein EP305_04445 [Bacteroidetes bacterium]|nr:MAG: hypothetical protein EP305_04445 [Bacteroidota bacterium]
MGVLLNYDLKDQHTPVKNAMKEKGYQDYFEFYKTVDGVEGKKRIKLPNTTLYHGSKTAASARDELMAVAKTKNSLVEFILATSFDPDVTPWASLNL